MKQIELNSGKFTTLPGFISSTISSYSVGFDFDVTLKITFPFAKGPRVIIAAEVLPTWFGPTDKILSEGIWTYIK